MSLKYFNKKLLSDEQLNFANWPQVNTNDFESAELDRFNRYKFAITLFLTTDTKINDICKEHRVNKSEFYRQFKRCIKRYDKNSIYGWRGLIKYKRTEAYKREKKFTQYPSRNKGGMSGALRCLFDEHPEVEKLVTELFLKQKLEEINESRIPLEAIHKRFMDACRAENIPGHAYPFNTVEHGIRALSAYLKHLLRETKLQRQIVAARGGAKSAEKLGSGMQGICGDLHPLQEVQLDGWRIDAKWTIRFEDRYYGMTAIDLANIWLLCMKDKKSKAVLGYTLSLNQTYSSFDLLRTLKAALRPSPPMKFTIEGFKYPPQGGIPANVLPAYAYATYGMVIFDNTKAHLADRTRETLEMKLGCPVNFGSIFSRDHQPVIENHFTQAARIFRRMPNTTGVDYKDSVKAKHPEKVALYYDMTFYDLLEIIEYSIAKYNSTPQHGLDGLTPMEVLDRYASLPDVIINKIDEADRKSLFWLDEYKKVTVRGNMLEGRRPFVNFYYATYTSQTLAESPQLIGAKITIVYDPTSDGRIIYAFLPDGSELGPLVVKGQWNAKYHTIEHRIRIKQLMKSKKLSENADGDLVQMYLKYLYKCMRKNAKAANEFAQYFYTQFLELRQQFIGGEIPDSAASTSEDPRVIIPGESETTTPEPLVRKKAMVIDDASYH